MSLFNPSPRSALEYLPKRHDLRSLEAAAAQCQGCDLCQRATQVVFGEGRVHPALFLVGEQPGDREDQNGRPFVGPAGLLLDKCLESAHLSAIRRMCEPEAKEAEIASLVADLKLAAQYVSAPRAK